ncbi:FAD-dependent monooxygenase [Variovorax sp. Sphag1AA]|uniref:FAD-dependent monooxygenase n=1 Tax=Variovorax sp. Sphag1AA TaxID=2587027 RepID=UPI00161D7B8C|nr:FAD-dependent monooxygenase [Variovorax sp. Sphag1AA]MBB3177627.1 2-polyprenyl-6-methoxyphenol hydroxylase-like FAD-dependent oxidoreductase [Variovorax sp. Sphag1AA]
MKIRIVGGGPAGLFYAYLMKSDDPSHDIRVYERDPESATYGWGVVFSDVALAFVRDVAPELYESMTRNQEVFDEMAVVHQGVHVTLAHNTFHRMARIDLLKALHAHCRQVGVVIEFERRFEDVDAFADADLIVAADGANSTIRTRYKEHFQPTLDERPNLLAWYGTTQLFNPLSLIFRQNPDGLAIAHTYRYSRTHSTFLVEVDPATFEKAGLGRMSEAQSLAWCEQVFADDLQGHALLSNKSNWFRYTIVKNRNWHYRNIVLIGDALRTGHPSVGSGTRLAMQDSIALFDAYKTCGNDVPKMLDEFVRIRQPGSDSLQKAAIRSTEWYENLGPKLPLDPISFAYDYVTRSGRVDHDDVRKRDPELAAAYEKLHPELSF